MDGVIEAGQLLQKREARLSCDRMYMTVVEPDPRGSGFSGRAFSGKMKVFFCGHAPARMKMQIRVKPQQLFKLCQILLLRRCCSGGCGEEFSPGSRGQGFSAQLLTIVIQKGIVHVKCRRIQRLKTGEGMTEQTGIPQYVPHVRYSAQSVDLGS